MQAITELFAIMSTVNPVVTTAVATGTTIDMYEWHEAVFMSQNGITTGGYHRMSVFGSTSATVPSAVISGASGASSTVTGGVIVIRVSAQDVAAEGYRYITPFVYASGTTAVAVNCIGLGVRPRYGPADELDSASSVVEIIT